MKRIVRVLAVASAITMATLTSSAEVLDNWTISFEPAPALASGKDRKDNGHKQEKRVDKKQDEGKKEKKSEKKQSARSEAKASSKAESEAKAKGGDGKSINVGNVPVQNNVQLGGPAKEHDKVGKKDYTKDSGKESERCQSQCDEHKEPPRQQARNDDQKTSVGNGGDAVAKSGDAYAGDATATSTATNTADCCPPEHQPDATFDGQPCGGTCDGGKRDGKSAGGTDQHADSDADARSEAESEAKAEGGDGKSINVATIPIQNNTQVSVLGGKQYASNDDQTTEVGNGGDAFARSGDAVSGDAVATSDASNTTGCCPTEQRPDGDVYSDGKRDGKSASGTDQHADSDADASSKAESEAEAEGGDGKSINVATIPVQNNTQVSVLGGKQYASNDDQTTEVGNGGDAKAKSGDAYAGDATATSSADNTASCCPTEQRSYTGSSEPCGGTCDGGKRPGGTDQNADSDADARSEAESEAKAEGGDGKSINLITVPIQNNAQVSVLGGDQYASNDDQSTEVGNGGDAVAESGDAYSGDASATSDASNTAARSPEPVPAPALL